MSESRRLIAELKKYDIPHEAMFVSGEGHGMAYLAHEVELYSRVEAFLAQNLTPRANGHPWSHATIWGDGIGRI